MIHALTIADITSILRLNLTFKTRSRDGVCEHGQHAGLIVTNVYWALALFEGSHQSGRLSLRQTWKLKVDMILNDHQWPYGPSLCVLTLAKHPAQRALSFGGYSRRSASGALMTCTRAGHAGASRTLTGPS